jgi:hypothetical protein
MRSGEQVSNFVGRINELYQLLERAQYAMDEELKVATLVAKLTTSWRKVAQDMVDRDLLKGHHVSKVGYPTNHPRKE